MLQQLGISQLFESGCDLKGVCETEDLFVDDVIHKAVVEVCFELVCLGSYHMYILFTL